MNCIGKTFSYLKSNFWLLALGMLVPAVLLAVLVQPLNLITFLPAYAATDMHSFADVVWLVFDKYALTYVYPYVIVFVVCVLGFSFTLSLLENHFRVGKIMIGRAFKNINVCLVPVAISFAAVFIAYMLASLLLACAVTLVHMLISGGGRANLADYVVTSVLTVAIFMGMLQLSKTAFFWAPMMVGYGYSFLDAVIETSAAVSKAPGRVYFGLFLPFAAAIFIEAFLGVFGLPAWSFYILDTILYVAILAYLGAFIMVTIFELTGMERRDLKLSKYWE